MDVDTEKTSCWKPPRFPHLFYFIIYLFYEARKCIFNSVAFTDEICSNQRGDTALAGAVHWICRGPYNFQGSDLDSVTTTENMELGSDDWELVLSWCLMAAQRRTGGNSHLSLAVEAVTEGSDEYFVR